MEEERFAKEPLLYIHQAEAKKVTANMQHHYRSPKKKEEAKKEDTPRKVYQHHTFEDENESGEKNKAFHDMTVEEQLTYLKDRPDFAPRRVCEVKTDERAYRGTILSYEDGTVLIQTGRRRMEIPKDKITRIRMLSL